MMLPTLIGKPFNIILTVNAPSSIHLCLSFCFAQKSLTAPFQNEQKSSGTWLNVPVTILTPGLVSTKTVTQSDSFGLLRRSQR